MKDKNYLDKTIGDIVTDEFGAAKIFTANGIDFCCGGNKTLDQACKEKNIEGAKILNELKQIESVTGNSGTNFKDWALGFLSDYIVNTHHKYVLKTLPDLVFYTDKIATVHGEHHKELLEVASIFSKINTELLQHLKMEEDVLFPAIKRALKEENKEVREKIRSEIQRMNGEHEFAGGAMDKINEMTKDYQVPEDGCNTYHVTMRLLKEFEDDLHIHVHLENNILYKKALHL